MEHCVLQAGGGEEKYTNRRNEQTESEHLSMSIITYSALRRRDRLLAPYLHHYEKTS
jgi:hypothetical protein